MGCFRPTHEPLHSTWTAAAPPQHSSLFKFTIVTQQHIYFYLRVYIVRHHILSYSSVSLHWNYLFLYIHTQMSTCNSLWPVCHSCDFCLSLYNFCISFSSELVIGSWRPFGVWVCFRFLPTGESFLGQCCTLLALGGSTCFFLWLYKPLWDAFACDLLLYKLKLMG